MSFHVTTGATGAGINKEMTRKSWQWLGAGAVVAAVAGYWSVTRLPSAEQNQVAQAARVMGIDTAKFQKATELVNRIQESNKLSATDRREVDALLASSDGPMRRYGIKALQFGLAKSRPEELERVLASMIDDKDESVRATVAMTLYQVVPESWEKYEERLAADTSKQVKSVVRLVVAQRQGVRDLGEEGHDH